MPVLNPEKIPPEAAGVNWPLTIHICQTCSRPTLFKEDRCCQGFMVAVQVMPIRREVEDWLIEELDLNVRAYNCLKRANIHTVGQLLEKSRSYITAIPNMGKLTQENIEETLAKHGLKLKEE